VLQQLQQLQQATLLVLRKAVQQTPQQDPALYTQGRQCETVRGWQG